MIDNKLKSLLKNVMNKSISDKDFDLLKDAINNGDDSINKALDSLWDEHFEDYLNTERKVKILHEIESKIEKNQTEISERNRFHLGRSLLKIAALVCFICLNYFAIKYFTKSDSFQNENTLIVETLKGERVNLHLPDSSEITLNGGTKLEYPQSFGNTNREVIFNGEAYFKIAKDTNSIFRIKIDDFWVEVLGTEFNIQTSLSSIELSLISGKVKIIPDCRSTNSYLLNSGQKACFDRQTREIIIQENEGKEIYWLNKKLTFKSISLMELFFELETTFGVTFHVNLPEKVKRDRFTAVFEGKGLQDILQTLTKFYKFTYQIINDDVYINPIKTKND